jgi:LPXTG-motif cell wall-anchored protein
MLLKNISKKLSYVGATLVLMTAQVTPFFVFAPKAGASNNNNESHKVRICHATSSSSNPYSSTPVDDDAIDGNGNGSSDHNRIDHQNGEDIIPPTYIDGSLGTWPTRNWDAEGQAIWRNDCNTKGSIKIIKDTLPNSENNFDFNINQDGSGLYDNFELEDDGNNNDNERNYRTFDDLETDVYVITEESDSDWMLNSVVCTGSQYSVDLQNRKVSVTLGVAQNAECTFVNKPKPETGSVKVNKMVDTDGNGTYDGSNTTANNIGFMWGLDSESVDNTMGSTQTNVATGSHAVTENSLAGYQYTGWFYTSEYDTSGQNQENCNYPRGTAFPVNITVEKNKTNEITLCNKKLPNGYIKVIKDVVNNNGGTKTFSDFNFSLDGAVAQDFDADLTDSNNLDGTKTLTLPAGNYNISEPEEDSMGYKTTYTNCSNISVVPGQTKTCIIKNDDIAPSLTLEKQVVNSNKPASSWTLTADGDRQDSTDLSGKGSASSSTNFKADTYTLDESGPAGFDASPWTCTNGVVVNGNNQITLSLGQTTTCTIKNTAKPVTIVATKIVCEDENKLPNWGSGTEQNITAITAIRWVGLNQGCELVEGWSFEYALEKASAINNPGDNNEASDSVLWNEFGQTDENGQISTEISDVSGVNKIWVREQLKPGYLGFTYNTPAGNSNTVSAEIYCNKDVLNYDNFDFIDRVEIGNTYYCVAWNVELKGTVEVTKFNDANNNGIWDEGEVTLPDWEMELTPVDNCEEYSIFESEEESPDCEVPETITEETNEDGVAVFSNVASGWYTVGEDDEPGWEQTVIYCEDEEYASRLSDSDNTKNIYVGAGQTVKCVIGNYDTPGDGGTGGEEKGTIVVTKFNDMNNNKTQDAGEPNMPGWEIVIEGEGVKLTKTTGIDGRATFTDLELGNYKVSEILQDGWVQTVNFCANNENQECVVGEEPVNCFIGNYKKPSTPGVLGATTTTSPPVVLASTGQNTTFETIVGMLLIGGALLVTVSQRKTTVKSQI